MLQGPSGHRFNNFKPILISKASRCWVVPRHKLLANKSPTLLGNDNFPVEDVVFMVCRLENAKQKNACAIVVCGC